MFWWGLAAGLVAGPFIYYGLKKLRQRFGSEE
jgi:hypothetical protein